MNLLNKLLPAAAAIAIMALAGLLASAAQAQDGKPPPAASAPGAEGPPRPPGGRQPGPQKLSAEQAAQVKAILAKYKPASLTVDEAKAIKRAFRDAGIRPGPGLAEGLKANGYSVERLEQLDPRPPGPPPGEGGPHDGHPGGRPDGPPPPPPN